MMGRTRTQKKRDYVGVLSSVFAIIIGLLVGFVILLLSNPSQAVPGFITILTGALTHGLKGVGQVFYYATPIILTGLSVGFAFKTGLFNIGTPGSSLWVPLQRSMWASCGTGWDPSTGRRPFWQRSLGVRSGAWFRAF